MKDELHITKKDLFNERKRRIDVENKLVNLEFENEKLKRMKIRARKMNDQ